MDDPTVLPLDVSRWDDLVTLFGPDRGAHGQCWCMFWRTTQREFDGLDGGGRRAAFRERTARTPPAGLLAYRGGSTVGWIAVAPRGEFGRLNRSPLLKPVDDTPVWAITCFYVAAEHRRTGIATQLVAAAVDLAAAYNAEAVEAYPLDIDHGTTDSTLYTGTRDMYISAGFAEVTRRRHRCILRLHLPR